MAQDLLAQDLWFLRDARKSVKAKKAAFGPLHHATMSTKVAIMLQVWSPILTAVMEIE